MRTEDVPKHIRDRVAQANTARVSISNTASNWHTLDAIRALAATMFGTSSKPRRAKQPANLTRASDIEMGTRVRTGPDPQTTLYERAWGKPKH